GTQAAVLHVFARTRGATAKYYYRCKPDNGSWSQWEEVPVDVSEKQIVPIFWNARLYLFWPVFTERNEQTIPSNNQPQLAQSYFDIQLAWSVRHHDKWSSKQLTDVTITSNIRPDPTIKSDHGKSKHTFRAQTVGPGLQIWYEYDSPGTVVKVPAGKY